MHSRDLMTTAGELGGMNEGEPLARNHPTLREHASLDQRVTRLEASLGHIPTEVQRLSRGQEQSIAAQHETTRAIESLRDAVNALKATPPTTGQGDLQQVVLAFHRAMDGIASRDTVAAKAAAQNAPPPAASLSEQVVRGLATAPTLLGALLLGSILSPYIRKALGLE